MRNLDRITCTPIDEFTLVLNRKSGLIQDEVNAVLTKVKASYSDFEASQAPSSLKDVKAYKWTKEQREALTHCYSGETVALKNLKRRIREHQGDDALVTCPSCGIGRPRQTDHHIPKSAHPQLAVHPFNLVPMCGSCNGKKSETWLSGGERTFLNPYVDKLPTGQFLKVSVAWQAKVAGLVPVADFSLTRPTGCKKEEFALLQSHVTRLGLLERYKDDTHSQFTTLRDAARTYEAKSRKALRSRLAAFISNREKTLGPSNWVLVLFSELANHEPFSDECLTAQ